MITSLALMQPISKMHVQFTVENLTVNIWFIVVVPKSLSSSYLIFGFSVAVNYTLIIHFL